MRVKVTSVLFWAFLLVARCNARPQELGSVQVIREDVAKEVTHDDLATTTATTSVRSRYRTSSTSSRNINEFYNRLYHGQFTPGIINSMKSSSSSSLRLSNATAHNPSEFPNNLQSGKLLSHIFVNQSRRHHSVKLTSAIYKTANRPGSLSDTLKYPDKKSETKPLNSKHQVAKTPVKIASIFHAQPTSAKKPLQINRNNSVKPLTMKKPLHVSTHLKNWPNDPPQDIQDLFNYEKYTSFQVPDGKNPTTPLKSQKPNYFTHLAGHTMAPPLSSSHSFAYSHPVGQPNVQEIIQWLQIPPFRTENNSSVISHEIPAGETYSNVFKPAFQPNAPVTASAYYIEEESKNDFYLSDHQNPYSTEPDRVDNMMPTYPINPTESATLANSLTTMINNILNDPAVPLRRPVFRPVSEISQNTVVHIINPLSKKRNVTVSEGQLSLLNDSNPTPNVHIMFMSDDAESQESLKEPATNLECPTITINSITRVNNTIESKEGCTDLNIIINSQLLSTNNFNPDVVSLDDESGQDKYAGVTSDSPSFYSPSAYDSPSTASSLFTAASELSDPDRNDVVDPLDQEFDDPSPFDVNQGVNIEVDDDVPSEDGEFNSAADTAAADSEQSADDATASGASSAGDPISGNSGAVGQANDAISQAAAPVLPGGSSAGGGGGGSPSTAVSTVSSSDDDDDDFDFSLSGIVDGIGEIFTYMTFLNPMNYGIFSLAAAPFAAMAAGIVGVAAILFPWAFTRGLDFGRAADRVTIRFHPNLGEVVKQSIHYDRQFPEWKSKRKKRRRK